jgi:predicted metal-dependent phosphoesterase TrpH
MMPITKGSKMKSKVNLHIHTTHSDGGKTAAEIVDGLKTAGVEHFAITDHDAVEGNFEAARLAGERGLTHFNGVELSCCFADGEIGLDESWVCHILGLGIDAAKMSEKLNRIEREKDKRHRELFDLLVADGYGIELNRVTTNGKIPSRKIIAKELISKGYAANGDECYEKILNADKYRKYAKTKPTIGEGIKIIQSCGGLAIWAHPFGVTRGGKKDLTRERAAALCGSMLDYGIDGIEAYYHKYGAEQIRFLESLADKHKLLKSIGTDYHCSPFDEKAHPEYIPLKAKESLVFEVGGITADEGIVGVLERRTSLDASGRGGNCFHRYGRR